VDADALIVGATHTKVPVVLRFGALGAAINAANSLSHWFFLCLIAMIRMVIGVPGWTAHQP
jgi:hypothetical protein